MTLRPPDWPKLVAGLLCLHAWAIAAAGETVDASPRSTSFTLEPGQSRPCLLGDLKAGQTLSLLLSLEQASPGPGDRVTAELAGPGIKPIRKEMYAGDPDWYLTFRPASDSRVAVTLIRGNDSGRASLSVRVQWRQLPLAERERLAIEAEPNDRWQEANPLQLGRDVYGTADDADYLANTKEGKCGLDWFRFEVEGAEPILVYFQLDLLDRDVSANLRVYTVDHKSAGTTLYLTGKDPMEIVHDRERERYSKHISRTFTRGTYYLEVNANHPDYILRTRVLPVPPYNEPALAVEAGMHYIMNVGDAWFAQVPRAGNIFIRSDNIHDTGTRCTACHASSFSTEANLAAHRNGYPIRSKSDFQYVIDRIANSMTPLYGDDGLYWQRFIATPLQAQGEQGGILADFEREVSGRQSPLVERFGPFLKAAWESRRDLPPDELNAVIPMDSKFGFAWRDWRVLTAIAQRTGDAAYSLAAANIARILGERAADKRIETLQDRIHRLSAWWLIDRNQFANKIKRETGAMLALQNPDGGWHESNAQPGPSAVYTTGQLVDTLLEIGLPRDHPAVARALRYLLAEQQDFGGWFQTTTHENFRTPMRETRYAVMALARAYPRDGTGTPLTSWGNRDDGSARLPRTDSLVHTLDDLENLWDVPTGDRPRFASEIVGLLLADPEPLARAAAAACLGRLGRPEAVSPLVRSLGDPSKIVWRSAAWALRRLGNQGIGIDAIKRALDDPDPRVRRGATRIFAYQFPGMDTRLDLAERLVELTRDPDLWTRLQALRSLRQWFYRASDIPFQRRIIDTYLARMAEPDVAVVRKNLCEGLYIMLDENLGGSISLQKNIAELPEKLRPGIIEARRAVERDVLLNPVLAALERGNLLQRSAVLKAFDGSFLKGRFYARQPENMIDVGNDREFGFLYEPPLDVLERTFTALLAANLPPEPRRQAIQLCSFFKVPERTSIVAIQARLLAALTDSDASVRAAARVVVGSELSLTGAEDDAGRIGALNDILTGSESGDVRAAVLAAIGRNGRLGESPVIKAAIRSLLPRADAAADLLPVLGRPDFTAAERLSVIDRGWNRITPPQRISALDLLFAQPALVDRAEPTDQVLDLLRRAATDPSASVRERALSGISGLPAFWSSRKASQLLLIALADDTPAIRKLGLALAASKSSFWERPDAREHLARLLVDPDAAVRPDALDVVKHHRLVAKFPALEKRVKALTEDPSLAARAEAVLRAAGIDPAGVQADLSLSRPRVLSLATFRRTVNPLFYQAGEDTYSCARCHANHTILRIAEADPAKGYTDEQLLVNYNSVLKVVNLGEPESSLILRKPRSPQGQGGPDPASPTGLTHVGGPRWDSTEHPAYKAILAWIREASPAANGSEVSVDAPRVK